LNALGVNPGALLHDPLVSQIGKNAFTNESRMLPAAVITYGAMSNSPVVNQLIIDHRWAE